MGVGQRTRLTGVKQLAKGGWHHDALPVTAHRVGADQGSQESALVHVPSFLNHVQARQAWDSGGSGLLLHTGKQPGAGPGPHAACDSHFVRGAICSCRIVVIPPNWDNYTTLMSRKRGFCSFERE